MTHRRIILVSILTLAACGGGGEKPGDTAPFGLTERVENATCVIETTDPVSGLVVLPDTLAATGCYSDLVNKVAAPGLVPFDVKVPLWTDGAGKRRYFAIPTGTTIGFTESGAWDMPVGTIFMKEFSFERVVGDPSSTFVMETRFFVRSASKWRGYSYRWNDAGTDGVLLDTSATGVYDVMENGAPTQHQHYFPTRSECLRCHPREAGSAIGAQTLQMNHDFDYSGVVDNQIRALNHAGYFDRDVSAQLAHLDSLPSPTDTSLPIATRARAILHANCSHCHQPAGTATSALVRDMRYPTVLADTAICPQVVPGHPESSNFWNQISSVSMPPIAVFTLDPRLDVVREWISGLASCP